MDFIHNSRTFTVLSFNQPLQRFIPHFASRLRFMANHFRDLQSIFMESKVLAILLFICSLLHVCLPLEVDSLDAHFTSSKTRCAIMILPSRPS